MKSARTFRYVLALVASVWLGSFVSTAQVTKARDIKLVEGRGELLQFQKDVNRVAIAEPKIADAVIVSPREIMVNAKGPGGTTLMVWEADGDPSRYEITDRKS